MIERTAFAAVAIGPIRAAWLAGLSMSRAVGR